MTDKQAYWSPKFGHDPLTEALWMITLDGGQDDQAGTVDDIGWHGLIHIDSVETVQLSEGTAPEWEQVNVTIPRGTYIVWSDSNGFVGHDAYDYRSAEASEAWRQIEEAAAPTHLSLPDGSGTACGMLLADVKHDADINMIDCEECIVAHERATAMYELYP